MGAELSYDPVTAVDEASATGETAALFAEIRQTMGLPLVTSIWRGLAGMSESLREVWVVTKPIFESGEPEPALAHVVANTALPCPEPLTPTQLACVGVKEGDLEDIRAILMPTIAPTG